MTMKLFTFYWDDGDKELLGGDEPLEILDRVGYRIIHLKHLVQCVPGDDDSFYWDSQERTWVARKIPGNLRPPVIKWNVTFGRK